MGPLAHAHHADTGASSIVSKTYSFVNTQWRGSLLWVLFVATKAERARYWPMHTSERYQASSVGDLRRKTEEDLVIAENRAELKDLKSRIRRAKTGENVDELEVQADELEQSLGAK